MRAIRRLTGVVLSLTAVALTGCDTTQPLLVDSQVLTIDVRAVNSRTQRFNAWDVFEDTDEDGVPDGETSIWCEALPSPPPETPGDRDSVPWYFSAEIKVVRAGQTVAELLTSAEAAADEANIASYDPGVVLDFTVAKAPMCFSGSLEVACTDPFTSRFVFINPRLVGRLNRDVVKATINPITQLNPGMYGLGNGRCSFFDPGPAGLDSEPLPFTVEIQKGDTVAVTLVRGPEVPGLVNELGQSVICGPPTGDPNSCAFPPEISAIVKLDGLEITPTGDISTSNEIGSGISFSFTSR